MKNHILCVHHQHVWLFALCGGNGATKYVIDRWVGTERKKIMIFVSLFVFL